MKNLNSYSIKLVILLVIFLGGVSEVNAYVSYAKWKSGQATVYINP